MRSAAVVLVLLSVVACGLCNLVNTDVTRTFGLTNHLTTVVTEVTVKNNGKDAVNQYALGSDSFLGGNLAITKASIVVGSKKTPVAASSNGVEVTIKANDKVTLEIVQVFTHAQTPFPAKITQQEAQLVKVNANVYFPSPYPTTTQKTVFTLAGKLEGHTKTKPVSADEKKVTYGPFTDVAGNSEKDVFVHFENNTPFLTVTSLQRNLEVSHWGNVAVTEHVDLLHSGAHLEGSFSRLDYQRNPKAKQTAIPQFTTRLPAAAADVYYRDIIGNISTSNLRVEEENVVLEARPRFPLFGGWKTFYTVGYNLPSGEVLTSSGSSYTLRIRFVDHIYDNQVVDDATVRVILPEGASNINVKTPFAIDSESRDNVVTYLDTFGRPVVTLKKQNLVEDHMQEFTVTYEFSQVQMLREPVLVIAFFFALFLAFIVFNRLDFSIVAPKQKAE